MEKSSLNLYVIRIIMLFGVIYSISFSLQTTYSAPVWIAGAVFFAAQGISSLFYKNYKVHSEILLLVAELIILATIILERDPLFIIWYVVPPTLAVFFFASSKRLLVHTLLCSFYVLVAYSYGIFHTIHLCVLIFITIVNSMVLYYLLQKIDSYFKEINSEKDNIEALLRILDHDINNHLMVILNHSKWLINNNAQDSARLEKVWKAGSKIDAIARQIRLIQALQSNKAALRIDAVDLKSVVQETIQDFELSLEKKKIIAKIEVGDPQPFIVLADKDMLTNNVVNNLLSNAIKFSREESSIHFAIKRFVDRIELHCIDSGKGIPKNLVEVLFDSDKSTSRVGTAGEIGTGFGLPNVKFLLEKMNATIVAHSIEGEGSDFVISFYSLPSS